MLAVCTDLRDGNDEIVYYTCRAYVNFFASVFCASSFALTHCWTVWIFKTIRKARVHCTQRYGLFIIARASPTPQAENTAAVDALPYVANTLPHLSKKNRRRRRRECTNKTRTKPFPIAILYFSNSTKTQQQRMKKREATTAAAAMTIAHTAHQKKTWLIGIELYTLYSRLFYCHRARCCCFSYFAGLYFISLSPSLFSCFVHVIRQ